MVIPPSVRAFKGKQLNISHWEQWGQSRLQVRAAGRGLLPRVWVFGAFPVPVTPPQQHEDDVYRLESGKKSQAARSAQMCAPRAVPSREGTSRTAPKIRSELRATPQPPLESPRPRRKSQTRPKALKIVLPGARIAAPMRARESFQLL